jgi:PAS domain-containing protein
VLIRHDDDVQATSDYPTADGRWLHISRSPTHDGGFIVLCSDVSKLKAQERSLRETNLLLDAVLENMSQGLCLFSKDNRVEVFNRRYLEIFKLPADRVKPGISLEEIVRMSFAISTPPARR